MLHSYVKKIVFCLPNEPTKNTRVLPSTQDLISDLKSASKELEITSGAGIEAEYSSMSWAAVFCVCE